MKDNIFEKTVQEVPAKKQLKTRSNIRFEGDENGTPRIMFLGNSISLHGKKPDIGWYGEWGMAASAKEHDYVHLVEKAVSEKYPEAAFCIAQGAEWETSLESCNYEEVFGMAKNFEPDVIISSLETNIPTETFDKVIFKTEIRRLHQYLSRTDGKTRIIIASSYGKVPIKDEAIKEYAEETNASYVYIGDIHENREYLAFGFFEHEGVAGHPGDKGMECLAGRYLAVLNKMI